ncbi:hypothetical protein COJ67_29550 [Bacillus thuringiensis]|uniref:hypothetical protein n=1 Tax=Bacillus cereus group TaxID=86661 RepID=UPI000BF76B6A|nr:MULTISPECIES: hypothetical protein [Bacillus cereus group]MBE5096684.1 hypothetical protein [Bacillus thuringiensis]PFN81885.1 hypothetical protein COJ67_29550 [Bacillus thuringiensis]PGX91498.1 hypothetical protein COE41_28690 [Bacillus thuringiensis]QDD86861.1 hypothetical protein FORC087_070 [Bacillus cereus]
MKWGTVAIKSDELNCNDLNRYTFLVGEYHSTNWSYLSLSYLENFLEESGLDRDMILELLPINFKGIVWMSLEKADLEFLYALTNPKRCFEILDRYNLMDSAANYTPSMEYKLRWI